MKWNKSCFACVICSIFFALYATYTFAQSDAQQRPRIVVTADPELDDNNSLIRFLLYSTDMEIEGLIYASSQFHWKGDGKGTKWYVPGREYDRFGMNVCPCESWRWAKDERFIHEAVEAYEKVYPNLKTHNPNYPAPDELKSKIRYGNIEFDGDFSKDSPGSELIKSLILDKKPGPLYITAWGGQSTIARALKAIQEQFEFTTEWEDLKKTISKKVILLPSGDQDDTYAKYIKPNWPDIEYRQFSQGPNYGYGAQLNASETNLRYLSASWMKENITNRGVLGSLYRVWGDGKQMVKGDKVDYFGFSGYTNEELKKMGYFVWMPVQPQNSWLGEGDNPTFMNMLGNGLRAYEKGFYGGWGGRVLPKNETSTLSFSTTLNADEMANNFNNQDNRTEAIKEYPNFFPQAQLDFANRLKWSVTKNYSDANHDPQVSILGPLSIMANPGQKISLHGFVSDPDSDEIKTRWWQFLVGSYPLAVEITRPFSLTTEVKIPEDAKAGQTLHLILEATDNGSPPITRYQRVIITIRDN